MILLYFLFIMWSCIASDSSDNDNPTVEAIIVNFGNYGIPTEQQPLITVSSRIKQLESIILDRKIDQQQVNNLREYINDHHVVLDLSERHYLEELVNNRQKTEQKKFKWALAISCLSAGASAVSALNLFMLPNKPKNLNVIQPDLWIFTTTIFSALIIAGCALKIDDNDNRLEEIKDFLKEYQS